MRIGNHTVVFADEAVGGRKYRCAPGPIGRTAVAAAAWERGRVAGRRGRG